MKLDVYSIFKHLEILMQAHYKSFHEMSPTMHQ